VGVVFATDTLSQGINMPCRSVVVAGNDLQLSGLLFKQASGRSGRRGHDLRGDVIFLGVPSWRSMQLLTAALPPLKPTQPLDATFWTSVCSRMQTLQALRGGGTKAEARFEAIRAQRGRLLQEDLRFVGAGAEPAAKAAAEASFGAMKTAMLRLGALSVTPPSKVVTLTNTAGLLAHLFPLGAPPLALLLLLQTGALQDIVAACKAEIGGGGGGSTNVKEIIKRREKEAKDTDAALLNVLARVLYPVPLFHGASAAEAAAVSLQQLLPAALAGGAATAEACVDAELAASPLRITEPRVLELVAGALKSLLRPEYASALPGVTAVELLRRPLNPFILRFYASTSSETVRRDLEGELGVSDATQYATASELGRTLKALGFALAARLVVAEELPVDKRLMRGMFLGGSEDDDEEEEEDQGEQRAPRKKAVMDDFHQAFIEKHAELDRTAVGAKADGEVKLKELDLALALLNLAGRFREKFSQVYETKGKFALPPAIRPIL